MIGPYVDGNRIQLLRNPANVGYILTLRALLDAAATDIVGILDPDDTLVPHATDRVMSAYAADSKTGFVYTKFGVYDATLTTLLGCGGHDIPPGKTVLQVGGIGALRTFRRTVYAETLGLDPDLAYAEDRDLVYKLEEVALPTFIDEVLYNSRQLAASQSRDPRKREIGMRNHLRARCAALRRRRVRGARGYFWRLVFTCEYVQSSRRFPAVVTQTSNWFRKALGRFENLAGSPIPSAAHGVAR